MSTQNWNAAFDKGLGALARHRPADAVRSLQAALETCPASKSGDLHQICLYLGIALRRAGYPQSAIKSWTSGQRLNKRGHTRKMLARFTNCYGMDPQSTSLADDRQAFSSIQIARYLLCKNKRTFSTLAEHDMIRDLIRDSWGEIRASRKLEGKSSCEKMEIFRAFRIVFPSVVLSEPRINGPVISVNFQKKQRVGLNDRCACGSGMPHMLCCGRTPGMEELLTGIF
jgi:hypothetical protein